MALDTLSKRITHAGNLLRYCCPNRGYGGSRQSQQKAD
jgi:hypothetical protein